MGNQSMKEKVKGYDAIRPRTRASVPLRKRSLRLGEKQTILGATMEFFQ